MKPHSAVAVAFAQALVDCEFDRAYALLTPELRVTMTPELLREQLFSMFRGYSDSTPTSIWFDEARHDADASFEDWPSKLPGDVGWAYVGIEGDDFNEAVTVTIAYIDGELLIRDVEWGRP